MVSVRAANYFNVPNTESLLLKRLQDIQSRMANNTSMSCSFRMIARNSGNALLHVKRLRLKMFSPLLSSGFVYLWEPLAAMVGVLRLPDPSGLHNQRHRRQSKNRAPIAALLPSETDQLKWRLLVLKPMHGQRKWDQKNSHRKQKL